MASLNQANIIGYIGDEPKTTTVQSGRKVTTFSIATTEKGYTTQQGVVYPDRTEWHNIVLWGKLAEVAERFLHKGSLVFVSGKLRTRSYEDKNNVKKYTTEIEAETMQMLDRRTDNAQNAGNAQQSVQQTAAAQDYAQQLQSAGEAKKDDDLPF